VLSATSAMEGYNCVLQRLSFFPNSARSSGTGLSYAPMLKSISATATISRPSSIRRNDALLDASLAWDHSPHGIAQRKQPAFAGCGKACVEGHRRGKLLSPERQRSAVEHAQGQGLSERKACRLVNQPRGTQRYRTQSLFLWSLIRRFWAPVAV